MLYLSFVTNVPYLTVTVNKGSYIVFLFVHKFKGKCITKA